MATRVPYLASWEKEKANPTCATELALRNPSRIPDAAISKVSAHWTLNLSVLQKERIAYVQTILNFT